jgi:hypothetical protein
LSGCGGSAVAGETGLSVSGDRLDFRGEGGPDEEGHKEGE